MFQAVYRGHFSHDFRAQGVTLKSKAWATKCIFQIYPQFLDICTRLVIKTAEEFIVTSVCYFTETHDIKCDAINQAKWVWSPKIYFWFFWHFLFGYCIRLQFGENLTRDRAIGSKDTKQLNDWTNNKKQKILSALFGWFGLVLVLRFNWHKQLG